MINLAKVSVAVLVAVGAMSAGAAFAAPTFSNAAPGLGMAMNDFTTQLGAFNKADVTDLVNAKTVAVLKYDTAWNGQKGASKSIDLLTEDSQSIGLLRAALKADPAAAKLLAEHKIDIKDVVDIVSDGHGAVQLYVS